MKRRKGPFKNLLRRFLDRFAEQNESPVNFEIPADRKRMLASIDPNSANVYHNVLKKIFLIEMEYRENDDQAEYYENLYWCGFLLYKVGDLDDVELMWDAKHINMDTGSGFDIQYLVGAGVEDTIQYLEERNLKIIVDYLNAAKNGRDFDNLDEWEKFQKWYFYGIK